LIEFRFYIPLDTTRVISETFFPANILAYRTEETKPKVDQKKHKMPNLNKRTKTKPKPKPTLTARVCV